MFEHSKPKVVYAASSLGRAGRGLKFYFTQLAIALHKKLPNLIVISGPKEQKVGLFRKLIHEGIKIYTNPCIDKPSFKNMINGIIFFRQLIIHENADIIHVQTMYTLIMTFFSSRVLIHRKKVKILVNIHNTLYGYPHEKIVLFLGSCILNFCSDMVIHVAEAPTKKWIKYGLRKDKVIAIHNGIDLKFFDNVTINSKLPSSISLVLKSSSNIIISYFANLIPRKGHKYLIKAISNVLKKYPHVKLILTSDGPLKNELIALIKSLEISEKVYFTGRVSYEELYRLLKITDIYVFPSLSELFPFAILEAMAAKKPIVATDVGGIPEAVIQGKTGILVPSSSSKVLYEAIMGLIEDPTKARELGKNARALVEEKFDINKIAYKLTSCYDMILRRENSRAHL